MDCPGLILQCFSIRLVMPANTHWSSMESARRLSIPWSNKVQLHSTVYRQRRPWVGLHVSICLYRGIATPMILLASDNTKGRRVHLVAAGLNGTQTAPRRRMARNATGNSIQLGSSRQTRCPSPSPSWLNEVAQLRTCSTSCQYVYRLSPAASICTQQM